LPPRLQRIEPTDYPEKLDGLAPDYLKSILHDAYDRQFVYRKSSDENPKKYVLYSLGTNGKDDGGSNCRNDTDCFRDIRFDPNWSRFPFAL
jgi:hypothetical protein